MPQVMSGVCGQVDVGEYIFKLRPEFCLSFLSMIESVVNELSQMAHQRLHRMRFIRSRLKQRFGEITLKWQSSMLRESRPDDVDVSERHKWCTS